MPSTGRVQGDMVIKAIRYVLMLVLFAAFSWVAVSIGVDRESEASLRFLNSSLCIHSPGP